MKFKCGDRVKVAFNHYKSVDLIGVVGTVKLPYYGKERVGVELDNFYNQNSSYGYYYFAESQLEKLSKGESHIMNDNALKIDGNYRVAHVQFVEGTNTRKTYAYACYDDCICEGDVCVVKSAHHGFGIAVVKDIVPKTDEEMSREIICKVDFSAYNNRVENRKMRAKVKEEMAKRAEALQEIALYEMLSKTDPEMKDMLEAYKELCNGD